MPEKPFTAAGYSREEVQRVRATCLHIATCLGDLMEEVVIVGGLVPSLLIPQSRLPKGVRRHVGTKDLDVGLALGLLDHERYRTLTERLRGAGFEQDKNDQGRPTRHRWKVEPKGKGKITIDFLIPPSTPEDRPGKLKSIERDFAAIITAGLPLAFRDRRSIRLSGATLLGEHASKMVWVCGPGCVGPPRSVPENRRGNGLQRRSLPVKRRPEGH
jgi:hypothetical protein